MSRFKGMDFERGTHNGYRRARYMPTRPGHVINAVDFEGALEVGTKMFFPAIQTSGKTR